MARFYDVVCLNCGEIYLWCKYDPPIRRCEFCGRRLLKVVDTNAYEVAEATRVRFFEDRPRGYRLRLPNGVWCTIEMGARYPETWFHFKVRGERITVIIYDEQLADVVSLLRSAGKVLTSKVNMVGYKDRRYPLRHPVASLLIKAIELNEKPEVLAAVNP